MRHTADAELLEHFIAFLPHVSGGPEMLAELTLENRQRLIVAIPGLKERAKTLVELKTSAAFLFAKRPLQLEEKVVQALTDESRQDLKDLVPILVSSNEWSAAALEQAVKAYAEANGKKLGKLAQPLRGALTGSSTSPGIFDVLSALGREESLARINDQLTP